MKKHLTKTRIAVYTALLCLLGLTAAPATYARFTARVEGSAVASAAVWGSESSEIKIDVSGLSPGRTTSYTFEVTNTKDGKVSQVGQEYSITVETTGNLPLEFRLTADGTLTGGSLAGTGSLAFTDGKSVVEGGFLPHSEKTAHRYELTVSWPSDGKNEFVYADEIDLVTVTVDAKQTMPVSQG
ncbi:hypothetical protein F220043C3_08090 [Enterocloster asparagiformis]|uniref:hypothetical protein n=1 Tax=Enterocloster asparagiformis TaxID=333367 RepID=UPI0034B886B6